MYYSADWQLLEEHINDDLASSSDVDRHVQYLWGSRYIDDIVLHRENNDFTNDSPTITTYEKTYYHLTDVQFSTRAIIDDGAALIERVSYSAYGEARHHRAADLDGDGLVGVADLLEMNLNWGNFGVGDLDRDGVVGVQDQFILNEEYGLPALASGHLSLPEVDNQIGYAGYVFNVAKLQAPHYLARNRGYDPILGRWLQRDPAGYVDGMNLYEYAASHPTILADPFGQKVTGQKHHWIVKPIREIAFLDEQVRALFQRTVFAPWHKGAKKGHHVYNRGVKKAWREFLSKRGITDPKTISLKQAEKFLNLVRTSAMPEIEGFLSRIGVRARGTLVSNVNHFGTNLAGGMLYGAHAALVVYLGGQAADAFVSAVGKYRICCSCWIAEDGAQKSRYRAYGVTYETWTSNQTGVGTVQCSRARGAAIAGAEGTYVGYAKRGFWGVLFNRPGEFTWEYCGNN